MAPLIIGVAGDTNSGKSSFLNSLLGARVLSTKSQSETALLAYIVPTSATAIKAVFRDETVVYGAEDIRREIRKRNQTIRENAEIQVEVAGSSSSDVGLTRRDLVVETVRIEVGVCCSTKDALRDLRVNPGAAPKVKLLDMPGANELGNPHAQRCAEDAYCFSDILIVTIKADQTTTTATDKLFQHLRTMAPFHFVNTGRVPNVLILITHVDQCTDLSDSDVDGEGVSPSEKVKANLRRTLKRMECLQNIPDFVEKVRIAAISSMHPGEFDWNIAERFFTYIGQNIGALHQERRHRAGITIRATIESLLLEFDTLPPMQRFPDKARALLGELDLYDDDGEAYDEQRKAWLFRIAVLGIGAACLGGGIILFGAYGSAIVVTTTLVPWHTFWWGGWFVAASSSTVPTASGFFSVWLGGLGANLLLTSGVSAASAMVTEDVLDVTLSAQVGALPLSDKLASIENEGPRDSDHVLQATEHYCDVLRYPGNGPEAGRPFYVGQFKGKRPDGEGQFFWPNGRPAFVGKMCEGLLQHGYLIDDRDRVHGQYSFTESATEPIGFQPAGELVEEDANVKCPICMGQFCMAVTDGLVFRNCLHGSVCMQCANTDQPKLKNCPLCRTDLARKPDGQLDLVKY